MKKIIFNIEAGVCKIEDTEEEFIEQEKLKTIITPEERIAELENVILALMMDSI